MGVYHGYSPVENGQDQSVQDRGNVWDRGARHTKPKLRWYQPVKRAHLVELKHKKMITCMLLFETLPDLSNTLRNVDTEG